MNTQDNNKLYNPITKRYVRNNKKNKDSIDKQIQQHEATLNKSDEEEVKYKTNSMSDTVEELKAFNWFPSLLADATIHRKRSRNIIMDRFMRITTCMLAIQKEIDDNTVKDHVFRYKQINKILNEHTKYMGRLKEDLFTIPELEEINSMHRTLKLIHNKLSNQLN
jgi:hypothetical protein